MLSALLDPDVTLSRCEPFMHPPGRHVNGSHGNVRLGGLVPRHSYFNSPLIPPLIPPGTRREMERPLAGLISRDKAGDTPHIGTSVVTLHLSSDHFADRIRVEIEQPEACWCFHSLHSEQRPTGAGQGHR